MNIFSTLRMIFNALAKPVKNIEIFELPKGRVIDIGGGGEGVVAQAGGNRIVPIDKFIFEIHEARAKAPNNPWMVADATELPYIDHSFDNATAFFSCMYMSEEIKADVFKETKRVLKKGGEFWVWDGNMSLKSKVFAIRLAVDLTDIPSIRTIYGVKAKDQSTTSVCNLLREAGFETEVIVNDKHTFFIKAKKPLITRNLVPEKVFDKKIFNRAPGGTRTPNLLIRSFPRLALSCI